jgi:hypothetical protein
MTFKADLLCDVMVSAPVGEAIPLEEGDNFYVVGRSIVEGKTYFNLVRSLSSPDVYRIPQRLLSIYEEGTRLPIQIFSKQELYKGLIVPESAEPPAKR